LQAVTAVLLMTQAFWDVTPCLSVHTFQRLEEIYCLQGQGQGPGLLDLAPEGSMIL
jgi:hypothetical protein